MSIGPLHRAHRAFPGRPGCGPEHTRWPVAHRPRPGIRLRDPGNERGRVCPAGGGYPGIMRSAIEC